MQVGHHLIDIGGRLRAEIEMIGMLVHVEREYRHPTRQAVRVIRRPLVDEPAQPLRPGQDHPARTACERFCHCNEFGSPRRDAAEIPLERSGEFGRRLDKPGGRRVAMSAKRVEIDLVQDLLSIHAVRECLPHFRLVQRLTREIEEHGVGAE